VKKFLSFFVAGALLVCREAARADEMATGVAVVVNDSVLTWGEIETRVAPAALRAHNTYPHNERAFDAELLKYRDQAIEQMIEEKLILHDFVSSGYLTNVLNDFVEDQIKDYVQKNDYGDHARLIQTLHAEGTTYEAFHRDQWEQFIIRNMTALNSSNLRKILISPLKVEQFYQSHQDAFKMEDQVKLRMIVLPQSPDSPPGTAKKLGEEILAKIDSGVPFAEMAQVYSTGSERAEGGDRGWVDRNYFRTELTKIAFALKPGEHSGVIEQPETCYLMMVDDVKPAHIKPLSEVRGDIERTLRNDESLRLRKLWIERLKRKSFVRFY
jgi:parvulin-like peptidyl-prolyl isomerase